MDEIIEKAARLKHRRRLNFEVRYEVAVWLDQLAVEHRCASGYVARALIEDAFDRFHNADPDVALIQ